MDETSPFDVLPTPGATNVDLAQQLLSKHRADVQQRAPDIDNTLSKMQLSTDSMSKMLDDTTAAIKAARDGRVNLPLLAMGAGMLSSNGNFGQQLGAGLGAMVPAIARDRDNEDQTNFQLAQLGTRKTMLEQAPLEAKLRYMQALQSGDMQAVRGIEQALIRAQSRPDTNSPNNPKLISKAVGDALTEARKQVDSMGKEMFATAEEREAEIRRRFVENVKIARAGGLQIPDEVIAQVAGPGGAPKPGTTGMQTRKSYFDAPGPEGVQRATESGLPPPPTGYIYESIGPQDRTKMLTEQTKNFQKETKDFDETSSQQRTLLDQIQQIERILDKSPTVVGPRKGVIPNKYAPNLSEDAQTLNSLFNSMQLHSVPKGQGAVSNLERELFSSASPNMGISAPANKNLLGIQKEVIERDKDRRAFFTEYFNNYRTTDGMVSAWDRYINSPAGSAFIRNQDGSPVPNKNRMNWRDFFRTERDGGNRANGGYIKLGDDYD